MIGSEDCCAGCCVDGVPNPVKEVWAGVCCVEVDDKDLFDRKRVGVSMLAKPARQPRHTK